MAFLAILELVLITPYIGPTRFSLGAEEPQMLVEIEMNKLTAVSTAFFAMAASGASACVVYDGPSDTFSNNCGEEVYVQYRTVGGGCYVSDRGAFSFKHNEQRTDPLLSEPCGSTSGWRVDWAWCNYEEWTNGQCKPKF